MTDVWDASTPSAFRKGGDTSWVDSLPEVPAAIAVFDDKMRYLAVSNRFLSDYELGDPAQVIGRSIYETFPHMPPRWREINVRVLAGEEPASEEDFFPLQDGRIQWARWSIKPWRTADGRIGALLYAEVITDQVAARRAPTDSETQFRATFEKAPIGIAHFAPDGRFLRANEMACRMVGYSADELTTKSSRDITHPDDAADSVTRFELLRDGKIDRYDAEKRFLHKDGSTVWVRLTDSSVRKSDGSIDYIIGVAEDISARKQAEEELRNSEEQFRSLLLASPLPILLYNDREQILAISESWLEQSGYSREELRRLEDWTTRAYAERSGDVLKYLRGIISGEPEGKLSDERMIRTKDGYNRLWRFFRAALGTQSEGRRLFVSMAYDVSHRDKAYEDQILFLLRESNHRAKNMLSLVQAIARQTVSREPEDFIARFNERIGALASTQDLLVRNKWQGTDIEDLVRAQLAHFADLVGSRIVIDGPKLRLKAAGTQAIGLALYELATNAGKYGALSVDTGRVDVHWRLEGDSFMMSWTERNGPPVSPPERHGFGSTVVGSMVEQSVGGEVELNCAPSGLIWRLTCPATNALETPT